jgi:hypothetical protein
LILLKFVFTFVPETLNKVIMNSIKKLPTTCPACGGVLHIQAMGCEACGTRIEGVFSLIKLNQLSSEELRFVLDFVMCSGSLKEMAAKLKLSYPTVRNRLDDIIAVLKQEDE